MRKALLIIIVLLFIVPVSAENLIDEKELISSVPDDIISVIGDDIGSADRSLKGLLISLKDNALSAFKDAKKRAAAVIAVCLLCGILSIFNGKDGTPDYVHLCACAAITVICVGSMGSYLDEALEALNRLSIFSKAALPAMCTATAACGAVGSAAAKYAASALYMDIFITVGQNVIIPLIYAYIAVIIAQSAFNNPCLAGASKLLKWGCTSIMTLFTLAFTAYLSISSAIASSADALTVKLAKTAMGAALPVVGGIISDAASSVVAGAEIIKNTVGAFGLAAVLGICISPFALFGINFLVYKLSAVIASAFSTPEISSLIDGIGGAFAMLLALIGSCGIFIFISIMSCIKAVT